MASLSVVVLAAGKGKRLRSDLPKVVHRIAGRSLVAHVLESVRALGPSQVAVVVSRDSDSVREAVSHAGMDVRFVTQDPPNGTGDAVQRAVDELGIDSGVVLVANGDAPLVSTETFRALLHNHDSAGAQATLLTATVAAPGDLGRVVRGADGSVERIVEAADADPTQAAVREVNCGAYVFDASVLSTLLPKIDRENAQGEYYLTDVVHLMVTEGLRVAAYQTSEEESLGVNDRADLARVGEVFRSRLCEHWMAEGVTIVDPATTYIDAGVTIERDATILPFTFLEGTTRVGSGAEVGPQCRVVDSDVGPGAVVSYAVVRESVLGPDSSVGPFASLRPGTRIGRGARLGTFVETKNTTLGDESKANHLSYLGDAEIGRGVNVGAGTITCNWDGTAKHKTVIEDDAYIGSDTMLVAPAHIGKRAATGAGSVVKGDVPDDSLAVGAPARIIEGKGNKMDRVERTENEES